MKFGMKRSAAALVASVFCSVCLADACSARCAEMVCDAGTVVLSNACARLTFDSAGRIVSAKENATGRELIAAPTHFVGVTAEGGAFAGAASMEMRGGLLVFAFPGGRGTVALRPAAFDGGFTFAIEDSNVASAKTICAGRVAPACRKWTGRMANMMSDEKGGVCVRPYDLFSGFGCASGILQAEIPAGKAKGARFGIVAADRDSLQRALQAMTIDSGRAHSPAGGAWALGSEATRGSYLNADVTSASFDDWMDVVERGGFEVLHFRERWYSCRGHYPVNRSDWPGGMADMKSAVGKLHAAGYKAGLHTLTGCIDPKDPWVAGPENSQLMAWETYTLAEDLAPDATSLAVNEPPRMKHDAVFTYSGNGNALRIGNEIVQYSGFSEKPPYRYTGLVRGAFGTRPAAHAKGEEVAYLQQRYIAFYPDPDSQLADQVADAIANVYNGCGFDQIYCDGTEGMMSGYGMAAMREKIISRCSAGGRPCLNEDSRGIGMNPHTWWFHSRVGAWDSCYWAQKRFHDLHVEEIKGAHVRESNLMEIQMGWWGPHLGNVAFPCIKLDDMEYYASRNAGLDASMSIASINVSRRPLKFHHSRMLTVLGWYERARRARAFAPGVREAFDRKGAEFRLRQDPADGAWKVAPVEAFSFRAGSKETAGGSFQLGSRPAGAMLRVEALFRGEGRDARNSFVLTEGVGASGMARATAGPGVSIDVDERALEDGTRAFRLSATNATKESRGAWARATADFSPYRNAGNRRVLRFKVNGDGSGALLNVQIESPREYGLARSEHYVTLNFKGWRDFEMPLRERDADQYTAHVWPYSGYAPIFHRLLRTDHISAVNFYLNDIPAGGAAVAEVTDVALVPLRQTTATAQTVRINGKAVEVPFAMASGCFAELEEGVWTLYSVEGDPLERKRTADVVELNAGRNDLSYDGRCGDGALARAEVTVFAAGRKRPALSDVTTLPATACRHLAYEAADPQFYAPSRGFDELAPLAMRPGEKAAVEVVVYGPMPPCAISVGDVKTDIAAVAKGEHGRFRLNGLHDGVRRVSVAPTASGGEIAARFEFVKRYAIKQN